MIFQRGVYGEILPIWLASNLSADITLGLVVDDETYPMPGRAKHDTLGEEMILSKYQQELSQVLLGRKTEDPVAVALYRAVAQGEPVSLCPVATNGRKMRTFVPVLARIGDDQWQLGIVGEGRYAIIIGSIDEVLWQVWRFYLEWEKAKTVDG